MSQTKIQKKPSYKILGEINDYVSDPLGFLQTNQQKFGDAFGFRLAHRIIYFVNQPQYIAHILQSNHKNYKKSVAYKKLGLMLGNGLFTSEGDFWLKQRRLAQPAFHKEKIEGYFDIFKKHTEEFIESVSKKGEFMLGSELTKLTLRIITHSLLGLKMDESNHLIEEKLPGMMRFMIRRITSSVNTPLWFPTENNKTFVQSSRLIRQMINEMIQEKRKDPSGDDLLTQLLTAQDADTGEQMSNQQLSDEVLTIFLAGHETTAVSAFWAFYLLENHKEVKEKLMKELASFTTEECTLEKVQSLKYLDAFIKETMRYFGPVWVLGREALGDDQIGDYQIKKGDSIIFSPFMIHRHKDFWETPEEFNPDRFLGDTSRINKNTYFPFGNGPRLCIGNNFAILELKVIVALVCKKINLKLAKNEFPGYECSLTLRPQQDLEVKVHRGM